ncbi:MAG: phage baseplate assembly protein V [Bryobacteraceae bacterium]
MFRGLVRRVDVEHELSGACNLIYHGVSQTWLDDVTTRSRIFRKKPVDAILRELGANSGLRRIQASGGPYTVVQYMESDWSLLIRLADRHRCFVRVSPDGVDILSGYDPPSTTLNWREEKSLGVFRCTGRLVPFQVNGPNYDRATAVSRHFLKTTSEPPQLGSLGNLIGAAVRAAMEKQIEDGHYGKFLSGTHERFEDELRLEAERRRLRGCNAYGESRDCRIESGACVTVAGLEEASGAYGVYRVEHLWTAGKGYRNRFWCSPFARYLEPVQPAASQGSWRKPATQATLPSTPRLPQIKLPSLGGSRPKDFGLGVTIGRVVASAVAEAGARVRVKLLWEDQESETTWAPVLSPHAGGKRGLFFMPEVGDEVAITFEQGDPNRPIVLGSLWNGAHNPPNDDLHGGEANGNDVKRIVTKSGNRLVFDDLEGDEAIVLATPNHIRISMFEGDQTLLIHSDGDILIHAGGTIHMRCNQFLREIGPSSEKQPSGEESPLLSPFFPFPPVASADPAKDAGKGESSTPAGESEDGSVQV